LRLAEGSEDTIPLFAAAAIAYEEVFSTRRTEGGALRAG
jgi:hypothetical protein